jgi:hypothetical protein
VGAEDGGGGEAGLGCGEGVGDAFGDDEDAGAWVADGDGPADARVAAQVAGGVVVLVAAVAGIEVAGLDVADVAGLVGGGEGGGDGCPLGDC